MLETSARLLRLLSLLQVRLDWTGPALAERLDVSTRTIRNDVEKLRKLGYPIEAAPGVAGGYRLGAGGSLPPLLLDDDEAVAVATGLSAAASGGVAGIEESSLRALTKLEQVLPSRLRHRVSDLLQGMVSLSRADGVVAAESLVAIAVAIRRSERLRFFYGDDSDEQRREVEPHRLVRARDRWYLVAWDPGRDDWRTFRVDRMRLRTPNGRRFTARPAPDGDVAAWLDRRLGEVGWQHRTRVRIHASAAEVRRRLPPSIRLAPIDEHSCWADVGSDDAKQLALWLGMIDADFDVDPASELAGQLRLLGERYLRAASTT